MIDPVILLADRLWRELQWHRLNLEAAAARKYARAEARRRKREVTK